MYFLVHGSVCKGDLLMDGGRGGGRLISLAVSIQSSQLHCFTCMSRCHFQTNSRLVFNGLQVRLNIFGTTITSISC